MINFIFHKKNSVRHPKVVVFRFWDRSWNPFRESKILFFQNLTYSYNFLGWNLPEITMSVESLDNYFGITVKSRKNDEKFGFVDFCLWFRHNVGIIATVRYSPVNYTPKNSMINFFSTKKKNYAQHPKVGVFRFWGRTWNPFREWKIFFFSKFNLLVQFFGVKFTGN